MEYFCGNADLSKIFSLNDGIQNYNKYNTASKELDDIITKLKYNLVNNIQEYIDPIFFKTNDMIEFNFYECTNLTKTLIIAFVDGESNPNKEDFYLYYFKDNKYINVVI